MDKYRYIALSYRQGGRYDLLSNETYKIVKIPIAVKLMLEAINYQAEHGAATKAPMWAYGWNVAKANNITEVCFLSSNSGDLQRYLCVGIG